ncbi:hypothetical protein [Qipengyuania atrilutea]|uniref:Uncharacterized protein n=1 Tax=Qipengyuania atrilutea TaxID=2744473 RepID=A0A850GZZ8_9SPHN|nr:hypothetical protein [Actirhodobacter atriluteus]NVD45244.1 hypothetical protein [Actirhodobacter atriluteus]
MNPDTVPRFRTLAQGILFATVLAAGVSGGYLISSSQESYSPVAYEAGSLIAVGELESVLYNPTLNTGEDGRMVGGRVP